MEKSINSVYSTFLGGYSSRMISENDEYSKNYWQYTCFYGMLRFCKGTTNGRLKVPGVTYSLHINTYANSGPKWLPKCWKDKASNYHIAFVKQWPFVVIGFKNVYKYVEDLC